MERVAKHIIEKDPTIEDPFYIADIRMLDSKLRIWQHELDNVKPYYAIKCNSDERVLRYLSEHNVGFDCASKGEIAQVLNHTNNIIFAHPVKKVKDIEYAVSNGIFRMTYDSVYELEKMRSYTSKIQCILRISIHNPCASSDLGIKYGVLRDEYEHVINKTKEYGLNLVGISFHVGSGNRNSSIFDEAIGYAREVYEYACRCGFDVHILDIGGGFTAKMFVKTAKIIVKSLKIHFNDVKLNIIAEPGRFFVEDIFTLVTRIIGKRYRANIHEYWITDSIYGSLNCVIFDHQKPIFKPLYATTTKYLPCIINGLSCDSEDRLVNTSLPELDVGEFLLVNNFGAYTLSACSNFNGFDFTKSKVWYIKTITHDAVVIE